VLPLILGGAAVYRCDSKRSIPAALAAEVRMQRAEYGIKSIYNGQRA
jgi:hypothetical protein